MVTPEGTLSGTGLRAVFAAAESNPAKPLSHLWLGHLGGDPDLGLAKIARPMLAL